MKGCITFCARCLYDPAPVIPWFLCADGMSSTVCIRLESEESLLDLTQAREVSILGDSANSP